MEEIRFEIDCDTTLPHFHNELEIFYVLSGRCAISAQQKHFVLGSEDLVVLNPNEPHEMFKEEGCHTISAFISNEILRQAELRKVHCCSKLQPEKADHIQMIRSGLALLYKNCTDTNNRKLQRLSHLFALLSVLKLQFEISEETPTDVDHDRMASALAYIGDHFQDDLSLQEVASHVHISKSQLSRDFQKLLKISFSDYLRDIRLNHAAYLLRTTKDSLLDIGMDCGYYNQNTLIVNFRQKFGMTPGAYRQKTDTEQDETIPQETGRSLFSVMSLLKHAAKEETLLPMNNKDSTSVYLNVDCAKGKEPLVLKHNEVINVGWADQLLQADLRNAIRDGVRQIGFRYLMILGMFNDAMDIYHEEEDGSPWLSFTYLDSVLDFVLELGARPFLQLGFTPELLTDPIEVPYQNSNIHLPKRTDRWEYLVSGTLEHCIQRYGMNEVRQWKFTPEAAVFSSYGVFSMDDYHRYYQCTLDAVRKVLPDAYVVGGGFDLGLLEVDGADTLLDFLKECQRTNTLPKEIILQCFGIDYSKQDRSKTERAIQAKSEKHPDEPALPSEDPEIIHHQLVWIRSILDEAGYEGMPISLFSWSSSIWGNDLGNDTCFKAASIVKNVVETGNLVSFMSYIMISDSAERQILRSNTYHGGLGLMTYDGIPKASFHAMYFLSLLQKYQALILEKQDGYVVARSKDQRHTLILLYNYCHYDFENHISNYLPLEEQSTIDRYMGFEKNGIRTYAIHLEHLEKGEYRKHSLSITREHGSSYDRWVAMGTPELTSLDQLEYLKNISTFATVYEKMRVDESGTLDLSTMLDEHEVRLIILEK